MPEDSVDALIASWAARRPELEFSPVEVLTRLARVRRHLDVELERVFAAHGLEPASFALLATLERLGPASRARLMEELGLPAQVLDARLAELETRGLVSGYALTDSGRDLMAEAVPEHLANAARLLSALSDEDREALSGLLRRLLVEFEGSRPTDGAAAALGLTLVPAHVTADLRAAVELPPAVGLLVRGIDRDGRAAAAGLRHGDILVGASGRELRAVEDLYAALRDAGGQAVSLDALRGTEPVTVEVAVDQPLPPQASPGRAAYAEHVI